MAPSLACAQQSPNDTAPGGDVATPIASPQIPFDHVQTVDYDPTAVVTLEGCVNFQTLISLAPDESVDSIGVGNSAAWQVMPNHRGNLMFVKAMSDTGSTNMTVVSNKRSYYFELHTAAPEVCTEGRIAFEVRFRYPPPPVSEAALATAPLGPEALLPPVEKRNSAYTYSGDRDLVPIRVFDDGLSTYMTWANGVPAMSVYALGPDKSESLVNFTYRGAYLVIDQVSAAFVLRRSDHQAKLFNETYRVQGLDSLSPKRRKDGG